MCGRIPENEVQVAESKAAMRAGGWILTLVFVGLWIGVGQLWRQSVPMLPIVEAEYTVDINHANERDLLNLPEVGPSLAKKILTYREQHGDFYALSDLGKVPGVGPQTLKQLGPFLSFTTQRAPVTDASLTDDLLTDDPLIDDPLIDDPLIDDPLIDDPAVEDTTVETILTAQSRERIAP